MRTGNHLVIASFCAFAAWMPPAAAQERSPRYQAEVPPSITTPDRGYFVIMRLFGPLEPWFDQSWRPGDAVPVAE